MYGLIILYEIAGVGEIMPFVFNKYDINPIVHDLSMENLSE